MTKRRASAPSTADLYAGAALLDQCIASDLQAYLRERVQGLPSVAKVREIRGHDALAEIYVGLWQAANAFIHATRDARADLTVPFGILVVQIATALGRAQAIVDADLDPAWDVVDEDAKCLAARLALYCVIACQIKAVPIALVYALEFGEANPGGPASLCALGLSMIKPMDIWFRRRLAALPTPKITVVSVIERAREVLRLPVPPATPPRIEDAYPEPDDPMDDDRAGIVRIPAAAKAIALARAEGLTMEVFPRLDHLPGIKPSAGSLSRSHNPLSEFGHVAGVPLPLSEPPDLQAFVAELDARYPWYADLTRLLAKDLGRGRYARFRNTLIVGPPGGGKTAYVQAACRTAGLPVTVYSASGVADSSWNSTSRQWGTGRVSIPAAACARVKRANVAMVLDELDKVPPPGSGGQNGRLDEALLPFLESTSSKAIFDTYLEADVNLSAVSYLATANDLTRVPSPLRDRFRILEVGVPDKRHLPVLAKNMVADIVADRGLDAAWAPALGQDELDLLGRSWSGHSLRPLRRMTEVLVDSHLDGLFSASN